MFSIASQENRNNTAREVYLNFTVNKPVNWVGYSLDVKDNVTINGNTTLTVLSNGLHNLTVYVNDTFGNMGASKNVTLAVAVPEPFPTTLVVAPTAQ